MKKQKGFTFIELLILLFVLLTCVGWIKNIIKFSECDFKAPYKCEIIHGVGLLPPIGIITGWMTIEDE